MDKYKNKYNIDNKYNNSKYNKNKNNKKVESSKQELDDEIILKINDDEYNEGLNKQALFQQDDYVYKFKKQQKEEKNNGENIEIDNEKPEDFNISLKPINFNSMNLPLFKKRFLQSSTIKDIESFEFINSTTEFVIENGDNDDYNNDEDDDDDDEDDDNENNKKNKKNNIKKAINQEDEKKLTFPNDCKIPVATTGESECLPNTLKLFFKKTQFQTPTLFQQYAWPSILTGHDIIGTSLPGSGKTLGYLAPMIPHCLARIDRGGKNKNISGDGKEPKQYTGILVLVLVPTRELGLQVHSNASIITQLFGIKISVMYGGIPKNLQIEQLTKEKPQVLISTPGRLIEMIENGHVNLSTVTMLVLDEADKMLSKGLIPQLKQIRGQIRPDSQNILFSATFPDSLKEVSKDWIKDPSIRLRIGSSELPKLNHIQQDVQLVAHHKKPRALIKLLGEPDFKQKKKTIVFFNKIKELKRISIMLLKSNIKHDTIFGNIDQELREKLIKKFSSSRSTLLLSTDIIGRGIHIDDIFNIINYDFPRSLEQYCHRVGRAGRSDKVANPKAYSYLTTNDSGLIEPFVQFLKDQNQNISIPFLKLCNENFGTKFEFTLSKRKQKKLAQKDDIEKDDEAYLAKYEKLIKKDKKNDSDDESKKFKSFKRKNISDSDNDSDSDSDSDSENVIIKRKDKKIKK
ncbi:hypothetical protein RB653_003701 [Dictyostelium firmibasis]|uniref:RNA helicase n=1 Tax=Dictyostelium firmibasis TaxID=79012 RepID=A0AAN7U8H1_9MYCE